MAAAVAGLIATSASAVPGNVIMKARPEKSRKLLSRERLVKILRARHIRSAGTPYLHNGRSIMRCYDKSGHRAYCEVDRYSDAFIGIVLRL